MADLPALLTLNIALRAGLITLLLFVAAVLVRDHARAVAARLAAACAAGVAAYALSSMPGFTAPPMAWWQRPLLALSTGNAVVFWVFSRALFDDEFKARWWHAAAWGVLAAAGWVHCFVLARSHAVAAASLNTGITLVTLGFAALAVLQSLSTWRSDLVEGRRRLRIFIVSAGAAYTLATAIAKLALHGGGILSAPLASLADALALLAIVVVILWHLLVTTRSGLFANAPTVAACDGRSAAPGTGPVAEVQVERVDRSQVAALERLMTVERAYRQDGLTIGGLAAQLGVPEHKLRKLINQGLGYRNFNAFLNQYRIEEAKSALADPAQAEVPVLTIAMDAGFQSLGPFNRAFKADTGMTPTEFRRLRTRLPSPESQPVLAVSEIG
ncbi:helix-turn-helix domain-containing protein [Aquabacterium sp. A7-Y]|uniref:AraC family transcriptional regulator n=1 Tax=Aquabacterium sp. A7-Y TaxID=1349605 RepID=UPI00223E117F|nr:helix-turn-helix domain-containing protein [Aquabacterium sp. A7-Y]MCW7536810.1 helix-turn-helix domain-containing protein [Aquabacterium sp. A7-Y]